MLLDQVVPNNISHLVTHHLVEGYKVVDCGALVIVGGPFLSTNPFHVKMSPALRHCRVPSLDGPCNVGDCWVKATRT